MYDRLRGRRDGVHRVGSAYRVAGNERGREQCAAMSHAREQGAHSFLVSQGALFILVDKGAHSCAIAADSGEQGPLSYLSLWSG